MRLDKFMTECGIGSRSEVKKLLSMKLIMVNGIISKSADMKIDEVNDRIEFDGKELRYRKFRYYMMNKPAGVITAAEDKRHEIVMDLLPEWVIKKDLFPVGRLDKDTEGLLIFTNDGEFSHKVLSPKSHVEKEYFVILENDISDDEIKKVESGVIIDDGYNTKESKIRKQSGNEIFLTIVEGKFHQVKQMMEAVGNRVTYLKRVRFADLLIDDLEIGGVAEITKEDIVKE
jgi:16S rRNA pseudouridine516 synthase